MAFRELIINWASERQGYIVSIDIPPEEIMMPSDCRCRRQARDLTRHWGSAREWPRVVRLDMSVCRTTHIDGNKRGRHDCSWVYILMHGMRRTNSDLRFLSLGQMNDYYLLLVLRHSAVQKGEGSRRRSGHPPWRPQHHHRQRLSSHCNLFRFHHFCLLLISSFNFHLINIIHLSTYTSRSSYTQCPTRLSTPQFIQLISEPEDWHHLFEHHVVKLLLLPPFIPSTWNNPRLGTWIPVYKSLRTCWREL